MVMTRSSDVCVYVCDVCDLYVCRCPTEIIAFSDRIKDFEALDVQVRSSLSYIYIYIYLSLFFITEDMRRERGGMVYVLRRWSNVRHARDAPRFSW